MLLEFKTKNFKTFADEIVFSMIPAHKIQDLKYSILKQKIDNKEYRALSSAVIYGPNASGKTNIVSVMEVLKSIVQNGNINNESSIVNTPNEAVRKLELIPNVNNKTVTPVEFSIKFIENGIVFSYELKIDLGEFLNEGYNRKIVSEKLYINEKTIFNRGESVEIDNISTIENYLINDFNRTVSEKMAKSNLNGRELFLTNMFKLLFSSELSGIIVNWFKEKFVCVYQSDRLRVGLVANGHPNKRTDENIAVTNDILNKAIKHFGINSNAIAYLSKDNETVSPYSILQISKTKSMAIPVENYESYGTERFINMFPLVLKALETGSTLVMDEFDASIHPMAIMSIIGIFHNDEINTNRAQLIFNTHNPIFLNKNLFRRDEIKFIERDDETGHSAHYSLSSFKTSGPAGVRNTDDYMKDYFVNQYGSIRNIDFSDIAKTYMLEQKPDETGV